MTTIRAKCPNCGDVVLTGDDVTVHVCINDDSRSSYSFVCPECGVPVNKNASSRIIGLLINQGGVRVRHWRLPEAGERKSCSYILPISPSGGVYDFSLRFRRKDTYWRVEID